METTILTIPISAVTDLKIFYGMKFDYFDTVFFSFSRAQSQGSTIFGPNHRIIISDSVRDIYEFETENKQIVIHSLSDSFLLSDLGYEPLSEVEKELCKSLNVTKFDGYYFIHFASGCLKVEGISGLCKIIQIKEDLDALSDL